jgi:hypothetical protein
MVAARVARSDLNSESLRPPRACLDSATCMAWVRDRAEPTASTDGSFCCRAGRRTVFDALRCGVGVRAAVVIGVCAGAYHYSLATLLGGLGLQTPLAGLGLVPAISLVIAAVSGRPGAGEPDIHDRYLDYIIGIPLLLAALAVVVLLPVAFATFFWFWRLDLISLPLFAAAAVALCFGSRALWRLRFAIAFLALACPAPYVLLVDGGAQALAEPSLAVLRRLLTLLPLAQPAAAGGGSLFVVTHGTQSFLLRVGAAGAGVDGVLAFLLVGIPVAYLVRGRPAARAAWLLAGAAVTWALSLAWLLAYFGAGRTWGEGTAASLLNPYAGLLVFDLGLVAMLVALPALGLRFDLHAAWRSAVGPAGRAARPAVERAGPALAVLVVAGVVAAAANESLRQFQLVERPTGQPLLTQAAVLSRPLSGWTVQPDTSPAWAAGAVGRGVAWRRYRYLREAGPPGAAASPPVVLDLISTPGTGAVAGRDLESLYPLHAYRLVESRQVDLGGGVIGHSVVYRSRFSAGIWTAVDWEWPVRTQDGVAYERVILSVTGSESEPGNAAVAPGPMPAPTPGATPDLRSAVVGVLAGSAAQPASPAEARTLDSLSEFARRVVLLASEQAGP